MQLEDPHSPCYVLDAIVGRCGDIVSVVQTGVSCLAMVIEVFSANSTTVNVLP